MSNKVEYYLDYDPGSPNYPGGGTELGLLGTLSLLQYGQTIKIYLTNTIWADYKDLFNQEMIKLELV